MFESRNHSTARQAGHGAPIPAPAPPKGTGAYGPGRDTHLFDKFAVVLKYYKAVVVVFVLVVAGMMYQTYSTIPLYRAQARIHIEEEHTAQTDFKDSYLTYQDPEPFYQTQYRILQGRDLARRAVRRLNLASVPEFNGSGPRPTRLTMIVETVKAKLLAPFRGNVQPVSSDVPRENAIDENALVGAFSSRVQVLPVRGSRLVDVTFTTADPEFAARAVNVIAEEYVQQNLEFRLQNTEKTLQWLTQEVAKQQQIVQASERVLAEYREHQNALSLEDRQNIVIARLNQVNDAVTRARTQRVQREAIYNQISQAKDRDALMAIVQNPFVQELKGRLAELQRDRVRLSERYGEKHPEIQKVNSQIADTQRQIEAEIDKNAQAIRSEYEAARTEERTLAADLEAQKAAAMDLNRKSIDYSVLQREAQSNRQVYEALLGREKELRVIGNSRSNNVRLLDRADVPGGPFTPDVNRAWMMAVLFGLGLGIAVAFGIDYLDDTVKTPEDVTWRLKLHFLGLVPKVRGERHPLLSGPVPHDFGEAFRALRTALVAHNVADHTRVVAITSAQPLEGKTTTAANIALALAIGGARVLLIDGDMRRPSLHKAMHLPNDRGLSDLLTGQARMREVVQRTGDPNLLVITAGRTPGNPSELLASYRMKAFVQQLGMGPFDWVIIDTPPVLAVTDAVILAPIVSGITFVLGAEMTRWRLAERAIEILQAGKPLSISAVLNRVDFDRNRYYYSRYYGHQYKSYYAEAPLAS
ncbi:MAG TPA: polysaccharide biosynthesis tyrosine autokinase [Vicinamibacterales bacterium]|jgi:capsular exopolysaccharide synthesis family protein|nr:polysaccharide biosynthesis tyrosine autokinase [Vicinamibacterales bacterium]